MLRPGRALLSTSQTNANQENSHAPLQFNKTPARPVAGPSKTGFGLGGAPGGLALTARSGRVLGQKDGNKGSKGATDGAAAGGKGAAQHPGKPVASTSTITPPAPIPSHLRTPSPGLRKFASLSFLSPEPSVETDESPLEEPEGDEDREVEIAGGSSMDFEEEYDPGFKMENFAGVGKLLRSMPIGGAGGMAQEDWEERDRNDRATTKFEMDIIEPKATKEEPLLPLPKRRPLAAKPGVNVSSALPKFPPRKPFARASTTPVFSTSSLATTASKAPLDASASRPPLQPRPSTFGRTMSTLQPRPSPFTRTQSTTATRSTPAPATTVPRGFNLSSSVSSRFPPLPTTRMVALPPSTTSRTIRPVNSTNSLRSAKSSSTSVSTLSRAEKERETREERSREMREAEEELGIFGIVEDEVMLGMFGDEEGGQEEEFRFEIGQE